MEFQTLKTVKLSVSKLIAVCVLIAAICILPMLTRGVSANAGGFSTGAQSAIVINQGTCRVFYEKNADVRLPIASTTKILTAITVIENTEDLNKTVTVPDAAVGVEGSSIYLAHGEQLRVIDLLYGLMLQSGNDCAAALAIITSGSIPEFARLMNETAKKAGAVNSNFVNPHGLHDDKHKCSARDLAFISSYAMSSEIFRTIVATKVYRDCPYAGREYNRVIKSKNKILNMLEGGNGLKTGYTKVAGRCLVASATRDGATVISVVLNCGPMFEESCDLINNAFDIIFAEREELNYLLN